jgi:CDK-activating kinase assembly factor MAT1
MTLSSRTLDDVLCEKDTGWRRRILKVFNKVQADFDSLLEFNNYLEQVEDMIFAIVNEEPHAEEIKAKIKKYEEENKKQIVIRQSQRADEDRSIADRYVLLMLMMVHFLYCFYTTSFIHSLTLSPI